MHQVVEMNTVWSRIVFHTAVFNALNHTADLLSGDRTIENIKHVAWRPVAYMYM